MAEYKYIRDTCQQDRPKGVTSGLTWDDEKGMNMTKDLPPGIRVVWAKYIRVCDHI